MTEQPETPDTGDTFLDGVAFAAITVAGIGATILGSYKLAEMFRRKDKEKELEI